MTPSSGSLRSHCPVNLGLEAFGDRWALLPVRDIVFRGKRTYSQFLSSEEGFSSNILASRLGHLVEQGILDRKEYEADGRKGVYSLTEKGLDLVPVVFEITLWSAKHDPDSQARRIPRLIEVIRQDPHEKETSMATMVAIYRQPADSATFLKHYFEVHIPLANRLPGLLRYEASRGPVASTTNSSAFLIGTLFFESLEAMKAAFATDVGKQCAADRRILAPNDGDVQIYLFDTDVVSS